MFLFIIKWKITQFPNRPIRSVVFFSSHLPEVETEAHLQSSEARIFNLGLLSPQNLFPGTVIAPVGVLPF